MTFKSDFFGGLAFKNTTDIMTKFFTTILVTISTLTFAAPHFDRQSVPTDTVYSYSEVDTKPAPEKGMESLYKKWNFYAKYPSKARRNKIEGKVYVSCIIDENGELIESTVEKGLGYGCDEAAIAALQKTKLKWTPGTKGGKKVKVKMILPFTFRLN